MKIADLKLEPVLATNPDESIADVAERMHFYEVGSLAVVEAGTLVGIITERDILGSVADRSDPNRFSVRLYMTTGPTTVSTDTDVSDAAELMLALNVRHLPVLDGGRLVGMVSIRDVLTADLAMERDLAAHG